MDKTLLVPLDNTEVSEKMIREADAWADHLGSRVSFLHVINPNYSWGEEKKPLFEERFEKAIHSCEVKSKYEVLFRVGKPYPKILEMEEELKPLMILMAAHDHTVLERLFLGSNTDHILHHGLRVYLDDCPRRPVRHPRTPAGCQHGFTDRMVRADLVCAGKRPYHLAGDRDALVHWHLGCAGHLSPPADRL